MKYFEGDAKQGVFQDIYDSKSEEIKRNYIDFWLRFLPPPGLSQY